MNANETLDPLSDQGLLSLQRDADDMSREVTDNYFATHPECYRGDADKIRSMCKVDFDHHLKFLLSSMVTATPEMFVEYTQWLKDALQVRQLSLQHPIDSYSLMLNSINQRLGNDDQRIATQVIESGLDVLKGEHAVSGYYQQPLSEVISGSADYTQSLIDGNHKQAEGLIKNCIERGVTLLDIEVGLVQPAMYEIGRLWQANKITVAQEHLASAITQNALARAYAQAEFADPSGRSCVCACIEGNHHSLGLRMISDTYEVAGWDVSFLGADTPSNSILSQIDSVKPDVLSLSISLPHQVLALKTLLGQLRSEMGAKMPAVVSGGLVFNNHQTLGARIGIDNWYIDARALMADIKA